MKPINLFLIFFILITSCTSLDEAGKVLRNQKTVTTDEFLIEKKEPLVMPPDYNKIPAPDSIEKKGVDDKDKIKKVLNSENTNIKKKNQTRTTEIENSIIERIR